MDLRSKFIVTCSMVILAAVGIMIMHEREDFTLEIQEKNELIRVMTNRLSCLTKGVLPSGGFCLNQKNEFRGCANIWDSQLCSGLETLFGSSSVGDMGCGRGFYGGCFLRLKNSVIPFKGKKMMKNKFFEEMKKANLVNKPQVIQSWEGFEAMADVDKKSQGMIQTVDLAKPLELGKKFDWVMSIEVGEHIPKESEDIFIDNLVNHACKGVVVSWALPKSRGYHHVNGQPNDHIADQMEKRGLIHDLEAQSKIRGPLYISYLRNTVMVFRFPTARC